MKRHLKKSLVIIFLFSVIAFAQAQNYVSIFYFANYGDGFSHPSNICPETGDQWIMQGAGQLTPYSTTFATPNFWGKPLWAKMHGDGTIKNNYRFYFNGDPNQPNEELLNWHADLLTEAGVDFVILDVTNSTQDFVPNGPFYVSAAQALCNAWTKRINLGLPTPKIVFFNDNISGLQAVEDKFFKVYDERLFFNYNGKKLVLVGDPSQDYATVNDRGNANDDPAPTWGNFANYTVRHCWFNPNGAFWSFKDILDHSANMPNPFVYNGQPEQIAITTACAGWNKDNFMPGSVGREDGYYFNKCMDYAKQIKPKFLFIFSWNEWNAGNWNSDDNRATNPYFVDQYLTEYSSDIEPMAGGHGFKYYDLLRRRVADYKGIVFPTAVTSSTTYRIIGRQSRKALSVENQSSNNNANIFQNKWLNEDDQKWEVTEVSTGIYKIINSKSNKALQVENASMDNVARLQQGDFTGADNQLWQIVNTEDGYFKMVNKNSLKAADVSGFSLDAGTQIIQYNDAGTENQQWEFEPIAQTGNGDGLNAQYFNGMNFETPALTRIDDNINFDWQVGSPDASVNVDGFSARWTGYIEPQYSETYTFYITSDNGRRVWIDDQLIIDQWLDNWDITYTGTIALTAGQKHSIKVEYFEDNGGANIKLEWSSNNQAREVIPQSQLYSTDITTNISKTNNEAKEQIQIFPNPATNQLTINSGQLSISQILITDLQGRMVYQNNNTFTNPKTIDISSLSKGIYFVSLKTEQAIIKQKVVIQ